MIATTGTSLHMRLRTLAATVATLLALILASPIHADELPGFVDRDRLDLLFAQLRRSPDASTADEISDEIWRIWTDPDDPDIAASMLDIGEAMTRGSLRAALEIAEALTVSAPDYAEGWNQKATIEYMLGQYAESLLDIEETLKREPRHFGALSGQALIQLRLGDREAARNAIQKALEIHPFLAERGLFPELGPPPART